jgi:hypothetical protein
VFIRVAMATAADVVAIARAPYRRTLWTFLHLQQADRVDDLRQRGRELRLAALMTLVAYEPGKLRDADAQLATDAGRVPPPETVRVRALELLADVQKVNEMTGWVKDVKP